VPVIEQDAMSLLEASLSTGKPPSIAATPVAGEVVGVQTDTVDDGLSLLEGYLAHNKVRLSFETRLGLDV